MRKVALESNEGFARRALTDDVPHQSQNGRSRQQSNGSRLATGTNASGSRVWSKLVIAVHRSADSTAIESNDRWAVTVRASGSYCRLCLLDSCTVAMVVFLALTDSLNIASIRNYPILDVETIAFKPTGLNRRASFR